ncbi:MAG: S41 family peptidase [Chloracidobacterium sp.]|nr:S41 family peptidase [Chloracidobacterium sp.]
MQQRFNSIFAFTLIFTFVLTGFGQAPSASSRSGNIRSAEQKSTDTPKKVVKVEDIEKDIAEALSLIERNYGGAKALNYNDVMKSSIDSMLHTLDPHSNYFDAKEYEEFRTDQSSRYYGIGATIGDLSDVDGKVIATYIKATFDGAPANRAGLRYGDKIVEVNGTSMLGKPFADVRNFLRGPRGTPAKLVVERLATGKLETVDIVRDAVSQPSIGEYYMIRPGVGYLAMRGGFNQTTYAEFVAATRELRAKGMQQIVIDLRDNGGGLVSQAYRVANSFLKRDQTVFTQKGRIEGVSDQYRADNPTPDRSPVVVLVNRNTASASEILAGALQDHDRALIVGENTFGKGLVQNPFQLDYGSMLLLTIAKYETPAGRLIQRDYSNGNLYDYYTEGGSFRDITADPVKPTGVESRTDAGRVVYSGGGINPDVPIKPDTIEIERARAQQKLVSPIFAFALDLVVGRVKGFESYKVLKPILFDYDITKTDFPVTPALFDTFKSFAETKYKVLPAQLDREREFIERTLRTELVTAAYGSQTSGQVFNEYDDQLLKAIGLMPQAKQLTVDSSEKHCQAAESHQSINL